MILDSQGNPIINLSPEALELTLLAHRMTNRACYFDRYNFRRAMADSGLIAKWREQAADGTTSSR